MDMQKMWKKCTEPHALLHIILGIGLGMLLTNWFSLTGDTGMMLGWGLLAAGVVGEFVMMKK